MADGGKIGGAVAGRGGNAQVGGVVRGNPFRPGTGEVPPYLAGRDGHLKIFDGLLDTALGDGQGRIIVMYGPRGMGKTVLLQAFGQRVAARGGVVLGTSAGSGSSECMTRKLVREDEGRPRSWPAALAAWVGRSFRRLREFSFSLPGVSVRLEQADPSQLSDILLGRGRQRGRLRVLLIDEAHALDPSTCRKLVLAAQDSLRAGPSLLVLAGTSGLIALLDSVGVSFIERAKELGVGLLDAAAVRAAIRIPLGRSGMTVADELLDEAVADSCGYPFFVQLWGEALWSAAAEDGTLALGRGSFRGAEAVVAARRERFYARRRVKLRRLELLEDARAVARAFPPDRRQGLLDVDALEAIRRDRAARAIGQVPGAAPPPGADPSAAGQPAAVTDRELWATLDDLLAESFLWLPPDAPVGEECILRPGIPSLIDYVADHGTPATAGGEGSA